MYRRFKIEDFTVRDYLALERTIMANERTLLSYLRMGVTFIIGGVTGSQIFTEEIWLMASVFAAGLGIALVLFGFRRFAAIRQKLDLASLDSSADKTARSISEGEPQ